MQIQEAVLPSGKNSFLFFAVYFGIGECLLHGRWLLFATVVIMFFLSRLPVFSIPAVDTVTLLMEPTL